MKKITFTLLVIIITISIESCQLKNSVTNPVTQVTVKNIRMVANMISSSFAPKAVITYSSNSGDNVQVQQLTLDLTESLPIGFKASLSGTCDGNWPPAKSARCDSGSVRRRKSPARALGGSSPR